MPALPWTTITRPDAARTYVAFATKLPLTRYRHIPGFLRDTQRIRHQLAAAPGLVGYSLLAGLGSKTFWTVSVWDDEQALRAFSSSEPHRGATRRKPARMGHSAFETFAITGAEIPLPWSDVRRRFVAP